LKRLHRRDYKANLQTIMIFRTIFTTIWISIILIFYLFTHDQLVTSVFSGRHLGLILVSAALFAATIFIFNRNRWYWLFSGFGIWLSVFLMMFIIQLAMVKELNLIQELRVTRLLWMNLLTWGLMPIFFFSSLRLGGLLKISDNIWVHLGLGIIFHSFIIALIANLKVLNEFTVAIIFIIPIVLKPKNTWQLVNQILFKPLRPISSIHIWGWTSVFLTLFVFSSNLVESIRPFPKGYDAMTLYFNLLNQIHINNEMPLGIGSFYWLIYSGSGLFLTNLNAVSFAFFPFTLLISAILLFQISKKYVDVNLALVAMTLLITMPLVNSIGGLQQKVEGGLLFFSLLTIFVILNDYNALTKKKYFLIGLLLGYILGIKLSALIFLIGILLMLSAVELNKLSIIPGLFLTMYLIIIMELDSFSGMNLYHDIPQNYLPFFLIFSILGYFVIILVEKQKSFDFFKKIIPLILGLFLGILPLLINNFLETGNLNMKSLLFGKSITPKIDYEIIFQIIENE
jgi:hypothetical protein